MPMRDPHGGVATDQQAHRDVRIDDDPRIVRRGALGNGWAIGALVTGLLSLTLSLLLVPAVLGVLFGIVALVLAVPGIRRANALGGMNRGVAWSGLVTGVLGLLIGLAVIIGGITLWQDPQFQQQLEQIQQQSDVRISG